MPSGTSEYRVRRNAVDREEYDVFDISDPPEGYGYLPVDANGNVKTQLTYHGARKAMRMLHAVPEATREWTSP